MEGSIMKLDKVFLTLTLLIFAQQLIAVFKQNITRYLIKTFFTEGRLPMARWYTMEFINSLNFQRVASLGVIAAFTAVTFPLGIWIASYRLNQSFPIIRIISGCVLMLSFPVNFYTMSKVLNEMPINRGTITGALIMEASYALLVFGSWVMYNGANTE